MKKLILLLLLPILSYSQVGIGTVTPQEQLHVVAPVPTNAMVRVDGLSTANVANNGVSTNLVADANGTIQLEANTAGNTVVIDENNIIPVATGLNTPTGNLVTANVYTTTFTVVYPRLVKIRSTISADFYRRPNLQTITDGGVRLVGSSLSVDGVVRDRDREMYVNHDSSNVITGYQYIKNETYMFLNAGTYTITIDVFVLGSDRTYVLFGGNNDYLQVVQF